ncbi:MAG TPA: 2,3-bisphosphoglycerate-dependent phosphoglycerate mutase [Candidatus Paceibacterota bacterium]|jgi:2,3-bisphosphoglycerate-dependent phosphoglycerate mutase|nr:2,3-bisphosphoglycerate-dependent phosphoglycerate mutase [Candidatus Paceibacterota bacterium]
MEKTGKLIIARHHASDWNMEGLWQGDRDRHLTDYGFKKSEDMGVLIKDIPVDYAFASMLVRSIETLSCILNVCQRYEVPTEHSLALNERNYGDYTGKNKWEMEKILGKETWEKVRRAWDYPIPNGETLKMVYDRAVPYFKEKIMPLVESGKNVLVVAHGNSLRAIVKYLENISDEDIEHVEIPFGAITIYDIDKEGRILNKEIRKTESSVPS